MPVARAAVADGDDTIPFTFYLDERDNGLFPLVITTDERHLRGVDLRAPKNGLTFISTRPFSSYRARQQALGRVGRFGDPCYRVVLDGVAEVDRQSELQAFSQIVQLATLMNTPK